MRILLLTFIIVSVFGCTDTKRLKEIETENIVLKTKVDSLTILLNEIEQRQRKKFALCVMTVSLPKTWIPEDGKYIGQKEESFVSEIQEFSQFDDDTKYRFLDEVEAKYRASKIRGWPIKVTHRDCLTFDTYAEASNKRIELIN